MCERPPSPLAYLSSQEDQSAQGKETRYDVTRLDILEAFGFAGTSTTLLVSTRAKGLDLVGLNEPEDEILEEPEEHLAMDMRQRATHD